MALRIHAVSAAALAFALFAIEPGLAQGRKASPADKNQTCLEMAKALLSIAEGAAGIASEYRTEDQLEAERQAYVTERVGEAGLLACLRNVDLDYDPEFEEFYFGTHPLMRLTIAAEKESLGRSYGTNAFGVGREFHRYESETYQIKQDWTAMLPDILRFQVPRNEAGRFERGLEIYARVRPIKPFVQTRYFHDSATLTNPAERSGEIHTLTVEVLDVLVYDARGNLIRSMGSYVPLFGPDTVLKPGDEGSAVHFLQRLLVDEILEGGRISGIYDEETRIKVTRFQERCGLTADGIAGPRTITKLVRFEVRNDLLSCF